MVILKQTHQQGNVFNNMTETRSKETPQSNTNGLVSTASSNSKY